MILSPVKPLVSSVFFINRLYQRSNEDVVLSLGVKHFAILKQDFRPSRNTFDEPFFPSSQLLFASQTLLTAILSHNRQNNALILRCQIMFPLQRERGGFKKIQWVPFLFMHTLGTTSCSKIDELLIY